MKKTLLTAAILILTAPPFVMGAPPPPKKPAPDWVLEHQKEKGKHTKRTKPPRKIAGTAKKGAPRVSPAPVVKKDK